MVFRIELPVPALPESVSSATVAAWHKQPGEAVRQNDVLVDLETDKVVLEVPAPCNGVLETILQASGAVVKNGDILGVVGNTASAPSETDKPEPATASVPLTPAVRRLVTENHLDARQIHGSGKDGRITKDDVTQHLAQQRSDSVPAVVSVTPSPVVTPPPVLTSEDEAPTLSVGSQRSEQRVRMTRLRARIAERLLESQRSTATLTTFNEVDLKRITELRNQYKARFEKEHGIKLGIMSFYVKAAVEALKRFPVVNASIDGEDIVYHNYYDIGIAVSTPRGLVAPVLRAADRMTFANIEKAINDYSQKARDGRLTLDDLSGGTFTITNGGIFGSVLSTPILNPPQSAILGMHAIKDRPIAENGHVVIRPMMYIALSYDHRLIDGRDAVQFLFTVKELLEDPARLLLHL